MPHEERDADRVRLEHMLDAARQANEFMVGRKREDLETDHMLRRAVKDCVQEIGEAAARTSDLGRARVPELPWPKMVGMRHMLVHSYFDIDNDAIWKVATQELEPLIRLIEAALLGRHTTKNQS